MTAISKVPTELQDKLMELILEESVQFNEEHKETQSDTDL